MGNRIKKVAGGLSEMRRVAARKITSHDEIIVALGGLPPRATPVGQWDPAKLDQPHKPDKGLKGGSCNRQACQAPGANWFNYGTERYYCAGCAHVLNNDKFNARDAQRLFGHPLCLEETL